MMKKHFKIRTAILSVIFTLTIAITAFAGSVYTVKSGDTMYKIAKNSDINYTSLLEANPDIKNPSLIYVGQNIVIPDENFGKMISYTVKSGDTMYKIAKIYGISLSELTKANPQIKSSSTIYIGQKITIPDSDPLSEHEATVVELVNIERAKYGLSKLTPHTKLSNVARTKAQDMIDNKYFSHTSPKYGSPFNMMESFGLRFSSAGENIAYGQKTASEVVNAWMNSPGHRANILSESFTHIGVGAAKMSDGTLYWVQMFMNPY